MTALKKQNSLQFSARVPGPCDICSPGQIIHMFSSNAQQIYMKKKDNIAKKQYTSDWRTFLPLLVTPLLQHAAAGTCSCAEHETVNLSTSTSTHRQNIIPLSNNGTRIRWRTYPLTNLKQTKMLQQRSIPACPNCLSPSCSPPLLVLVAV